jgi:hypothetical protein
MLLTCISCFLLERRNGKSENRTVEKGSGCKYKRLLEIEENESKEGWRKRKSKGLKQWE